MTEKPSTSTRPEIDILGEKALEAADELRGGILRTVQTPDERLPTPEPVTALPPIHLAVCRLDFCLPEPCIDCFWDSEI